MYGEQYGEYAHWCWGGEGKKVKQTRHDLYNKYPQVLFNPV